MTTEAVLFALRVFSAITLLLFLILILSALWRDYRNAVSSAESTRRTYGQLIELREANGNYLPVGTNYPLLQLTSMGRAPTNTIMVDDTFASGDHAVVALRSSQWWLEDRQSRNGTTLNEILITQPVVITHGDIIGIGKIRFRLELED
jgi:pSer/pThr/pTyr-binding forkhead associated (FHA) protein